MSVLVSRLLSGALFAFVLGLIPAAESTAVAQSDRADRIAARKARQAERQARRDARAARKAAAQAPELDPSAFGSAAVVLFGGAYLLSRRRRRDA